MNTILFPVYVLLAGLGDFKEIILGYKSMYNQKGYRSFSSDSIYKGAYTYNTIMRIIKGGN